MMYRFCIQYHATERWVKGYRRMAYIISKCRAILYLGCEHLWIWVHGGSWDPVDADWVCPWSWSAPLVSLQARGHEKWVRRLEWRAGYRAPPPGKKASVHRRWLWCSSQMRGWAQTRFSFVSSAECLHSGSRQLPAFPWKSGRHVPGYGRLQLLHVRPATRKDICAFKTQELGIIQLHSWGLGCRH